MPHTFSHRRFIFLFILREGEDGYASKVFVTQVAYSVRTMERICLSVILVGLFLLPGSTYAAVVINEIAWMGGTGSPNDEWIELYNSGTEGVLLDGWTLTDNASLLIMLTGTLSAGTYGVLERTDDESAPGSAFLTYTGALTNSGQTLTLYNENGTIEDQVAGGENWETIGGNNETKETAQLTEGGWVTAEGTPGTQNATSQAEDTSEDTAPPDGEDEKTGTESTVSSSGGETSSGSGRTVSVVVSEEKLRLDILHDHIAYVDQETEFSVEATDVVPVIVDSLSYNWNFGDGKTDTGKAVTHRYAFPGTYVVVVDASFALHRARERIEVTVLPVTLSLATTGEGNVMIHNNAQYETDIGGMVISNGKETFTIPPYTIIVPNGTITLHTKQTQFADVSSLSLVNTDGNLAALYPDPTSNEEGQIIAYSAPVSKSNSAPLSSETIGVLEEDNNVKNTEAAASNETHEHTIVLDAAAGRAVDTSSSPSMLSIFGLMGVISIGVLALYIGRVV